MPQIARSDFRADSSRLKLRMANAKSELEAVHEFDFVVVNDDLSRATEDLKSIVIAQRCITPRVLARHGLIQALKSYGLIQALKSW